MTGIRSTLLILAAACLAVCASARAESPAVRNCTWCHGSGGQGYSPAPRLAGQRAQYIENQLAGFRSHGRDNPFSKQYMWGAAENLNAGAAHELALYFASLAPRPANDGDADLVATGRTIYQQGMPEENIVACVVCHGPNAEGVGQIPRLGGLGHAYLKRMLEQWGQGYHLNSGPPMPDIASKLSASQIEALAAYLSFIR
ncbi:MAG TPA: c-type cytochrome [Xanthobacteraceae bacterium]|nr:c-type cytochrome [Xanthobacteraceae bacterium]